jgi:5-methyltetrahydrofolate--homocysteine methyltransferase
MTFLERLAAGSALVLDGGMGSALIARGLTRGTAPELWNVERGHVVTAVHRSFVDAGSEAVQTNTFGGNPIRLAESGLAGRCEELNRAAAALARASGARFVIGDVGPTGQYLAPVGAGDEERWRACFARQAVALAAAGIDAFHVETMSDVREALVALDAIRGAAPGIPVMVSMTFERKKRGFFTVMGNPLLESLRALAAAGAAAVGANCSISSSDMLALAHEALSGITVPTVLQPNAGQPQIGADGGVRYAQAPEEFAEDMAAIASRGGRVLGGCCGTDPRFIAALVRRLGGEP